VLLVGAQTNDCKQHRTPVKDVLLMLLIVHTGAPHDRPVTGLHMQTLPWYMPVSDAAQHAGQAAARAWE